MNYKNIDTDQCDCEDCIENENACYGDCDVTDNKACLACREREIDRVDIVFDIDCSTGRI